MEEKPIERREIADPRKIEYTLAKIDVKLDSLEKYLTSKLEDQDRVVQSQFSHLDTIVDHLAKLQEKQHEKLLYDVKKMFDAHQNQQTLDMLNQERKLSVLNSKIESIKEDYDTLEERVHNLEDKPAVAALDKTTKIKNTAITAFVGFVFGGGMITAILAGLKLLHIGGDN